MMSGAPYNPLDKVNLARSIEGELLRAPAIALGTTDGVIGPGVYAIYYVGNFPPYRPISTANANGEFNRPIYVGKAIPKGGRKGGLTKDASKGRALSERLRQHASGIDEAGNLEIKDFFVRHLVVEDIWIPLGENVLIETFKPLWNRAIDGFGNKDPGRRRSMQYTSPWDVLHPGRKFAEKLGDSGLTVAFLRERVADYFAGRPLKKLPKALAAEIEGEEDEA
jgi:Eco29kI restriction endonuclease